MSYLLFLFFIQNSFVYFEIWVSIFSILPPSAHEKIFFNCRKFKTLLTLTGIADAKSFSKNLQNFSSQKEHKWFWFVSLLFSELENDIFFQIYARKLFFSWSTYMKFYSYFILSSLKVRHFLCQFVFDVLKLETCVFAICFFVTFDIGEVWARKQISKITSNIQPVICAFL